jgi:hypothetical protein
MDHLPERDVPHRRDVAQGVERQVAEGHQHGRLDDRQFPLEQERVGLDVIRPVLGDGAA